MDGYIPFPCSKRIHNPNIILKLAIIWLNVQGFVTDHDSALGELYGENAEKSRKYSECLTTMATRIATTFASLKVCM